MILEECGSGFPIHVICTFFWEFDKAARAILAFTQKCTALENAQLGLGLPSPNISYIIYNIITIKYNNKYDLFISFRIISIYLYIEYMK